MRWYFPSQGWFKCNSDGAPKGNPWPIAASFCNKDERGQFIYSSTCRIIYATNWIVDVVSFGNSLKYYIKNNHILVAIEMDSLDLKRYYKVNGRYLEV